MHPQASVGVALEEVDPQARLTGIVLAQVVGVSSDDHAIQVLFSSLSGILTSVNGNPLKVKVLQRRAGIRGAVLELPQVGEWGLVCFPNGSDQMAVWLGAINRDLSNLAWDGIGPLTRLNQHESGVYQLVDDAGNIDMVFKDGTYLRVGNGTAKAARLKHERQAQQRRTVPFDNPQSSPSTTYLHHSSGTTVQIDPNGDVNIQGVGTVTIHAIGTITAQSDTVATFSGAGPNQTLLGNPGAYDFIVLLAGLANLIAWATSHVHNGVQSGIDQSGPPATPPTVPVAGVDFTINSKAT